MRYTDIIKNDPDTRALYAARLASEGGAGGAGRYKFDEETKKWVLVAKKRQVPQ